MNKSIYKADCDFCCRDSIMTPKELEARHWWRRTISIIDNQDGTFELFVPQNEGHDTYMDIWFCPMCGRNLNAQQPKEIIEDETDDTQTNNR